MKQRGTALRMEQTNAMPNRTGRRKAIRILFFALAIGLAFSVSAIAMAQSTPVYQFGCWGVMSAGGGCTEIAQADGTNTIYGSIGLWSVGVSNDAEYVINSGHISPMAYGSEDVAAIVIETDDPPSIYLPFVGNFIEVVYVCPY